MKTLLSLTAALGVCWLALGGMADATDEAAAAARIPLEEQVLAQINFARQHPQDYADGLRAYRDLFDGRILFLPGDENGIITNEGTRAVDEAIDFLDAQEPLGPLGRDQILTLAARDHADAQGPMGASGHVSADGANPGERVRRRGGDIYVGEGISYGSADPGNVVRQLIVDDGVPSRGHRRLLFTRDFRYAGIGCGEHRRFGHMCVIDMAGMAKGAANLPQTAMRAVTPGE